MNIQELINKLRNSNSENSISPETVGNILDLIYKYSLNKGEVYESTETPLNEFGINRSFCYDSVHGILFLKLSGKWLPLINSSGDLVLAQELGDSAVMGMSQKAITDALTALEDKLTETTEVVNPFSASFSTARYVFPIGSVSDIVLNWSYNKPILSQTLNGVDTNISIKSASFSNISTNQAYVLTAKTEDEKETITRSINISFIAPFYYGNSVAPITAGVVSAMTAVATDSVNFNNLSGKTIHWGAFTNSKMVIAIPSTKTIARILDPNSFDIFPNFTLSVIEINSTSYNVYVFNDETDADGNYTIILN